MDLGETRGSSPPQGSQAGDATISDEINTSLAKGGQATATHYASFASVLGAAECTLAGLSTATHCASQSTLHLLAVIASIAGSTAWRWVGLASSTASWPRSLATGRAARDLMCDESEGAI